MEKVKLTSVGLKERGKEGGVHFPEMSPKLITIKRETYHEHMDEGSSTSDGSTQRRRDKTQEEETSWRREGGVWLWQHFILLLF